jgi:Tol biopolymer transport system component
MSRACLTVVALTLSTGCGAGSDTGPGALVSDRPIVFASARDGDFEIYVMDGDGDNVRQLTETDAEGVTEAREGAPKWSPDGSRIVFTSTRDHEGGGIGSHEIYFMEADGSAETRLTVNESAEVGG